MVSMSLTGSVAREAVIRKARLVKEYRASFEQDQRRRMAASRTTLRARARTAVTALQALERHPVFLQACALPHQLSPGLNRSNPLQPCTGMFRRDILKSGLVLAGISFIGSGCSGQSNKTLVSAAKNADGQYSLRLFDPIRVNETVIKLPNRAHDVVQRPGSSEIIAFDRRPGSQFYIINRDQPERFIIQPNEHQRHYYGHGTFSPDGRWLYTTENHMASLSGVIGIYDAQNHFRRAGEWLLPAPGPHDIQILPNDKTLVIAVGGIQTHPDTGRKTLNPNTLAPKLIYLNATNGQIIDQQSFIDPRLSIRHLDVADNGLVVAGMQYQGETDEALPLVFTHRLGQPVQPIQALPEQWLALNGYIASVAVLPEASTIAVTSPRGNRIGLINARSGEMESLIHCRDCAGLAILNQQQLAVSNGLGEIRVLNCNKGQASQSSQVHYPGSHWDNHMIAV